ncbi:hypothetical protein BCR39DRAFT_367939 [Naematelia encephala]|uniref:Uncharacterized protein n=1 Tax=Naematelia encephala TaxID=71784 RepID=A0A1Y2AK64_9TREE|nr:hypothetical protein BCR39DRAFT_367939 [Naematelia encephala]
MTDHLDLAGVLDEPRRVDLRQARWVDLTSGFSYRVVSRPGSHASRLPFPPHQESGYALGRIDERDSDLTLVLPTLGQTSFISSESGYMLQPLVDPDADWSGRKHIRVI